MKTSLLLFVTHLARFPGRCVLCWLIMTLLCSLGLVNVAPAAELTTNITLVGQIAPLGTNLYGDVWAEGNIACIGSYRGNGVAIVDISNPAQPRLLSRYQPPTNPFHMEDIQIRNRIGYFAANDTNGVHIVSLTNPAAPVFLSQINPANNGLPRVHNVFLDGDFLYQADSRTPMVKVFNVQNPAVPVFVRDLVTTDQVFVHDITVVSNRLYTSGFGGRTDIYDVSNIGSQAPTLLGTVETGLGSHSSWVTPDNRIMATCAEFGARDLRLYDVSDPGNPVLRSTLTSATLGLDASGPHNPFIAGHLLFVAWYQAGLEIFDIRDPSNPVWLGAYDTFPGGMNVPNNICTPNPVCFPGGICVPGSCFKGNWGTYAGLGFDKVLASDFDGGLIILDTSAAIPPDMPPFLSVDHDTIFEPESGTTNAVFRVRLSRASASVVSVDFRTANGSATSVSDFIASQGTIVFNPGETNQTITVSVMGEIADETDEYFNVNFSNPTNVMLAAQQAVGTIVDNIQRPPAFTIPAFSPTSAYSGGAVTLTGTNLTWATRVLFNGASALFSHVATNFGRQIAAIVPADAATGPITIETPHGNVTTTNNFTVLVRPLLAIRPLPALNLVELSWLSSPGFLPQRTDTLGPAAQWVSAQFVSTWTTNNNTVRVVTVTNPVPNRFFRLYRP